MNTIFWTILIVIVIVLIVLGVVSAQSNFISYEYPLTGKDNIQHNMPHYRESQCEDDNEEKSFGNDVIAHLSIPPGSTDSSCPCNSIPDDTPPADFDLNTLYLGRVNYNILPKIQDSTLVSYKQNNAMFRELCDYDDDEVWWEGDYLNNKFKEPCLTCKDCGRIEADCECCRCRN
jgi:hypothetical protein